MGLTGALCARFRPETETTMKQVKSLARGAIFAALYAALTYLQNLLLPGTTSSVIQFRLSEALCVFALFTSDAVWGLPLGCFLFNLSSAGALPLDWLVGTVASFLAAIAMHRLRGVRLRGFPLPALLMPAVCNGLLVGVELTVYLGEFPFWLNALYVAIGELGVLLVPGTALFFAFSARGLKNRLFPEEKE